MCLDKKGKTSPCKVDNQEGNLVIEYKSKSNADLNKTIPGRKITALTSGEFSKRPVAGAVAAGVLLSPVFLFTLFAKKKIENYGIQFIDAKGNPDSTLIQIKKKYSEAMRAMLESISGKSTVVIEPEKKKK